MTWIIRTLLIMGGFVAGFFVAKDSNSFPVVSFVASLLILTFFIAFWAFLPALRRFWRNITRKNPPSDDAGI